MNSCFKSGSTSHSAAATEALQERAPRDVGRKKLSAPAAVEQTTKDHGQEKEECPLEYPNCGGDIQLIAFNTERGGVLSSALPRLSRRRSALWFSGWAEGREIAGVAVGAAGMADASAVEDQRVVEEGPAVLWEE